MTKVNKAKYQKWNENFLDNNAAVKGKILSKNFYLKNCTNYGLDPVPELFQTAPEQE